MYSQKYNIDLIVRTKAKYKIQNKRISGMLTIDKQKVLFISSDSSLTVEIPIYRIVQTGFKRKFFSCEKYFYFKTSDGKPCVFYVKKPKECMKKLDSLVYFKH